MMNESEFKRRLVEQCVARGAHAERHEDRYGVGRLDLAIKFRDHPHVLAEGKLVKHQTFAPTPAQYLNGQEYLAAGGIAVLLGWDPKTKIMYIHKWSKTATKEDSFSGESDYAGQLEAWLELEAWL